MTSEESPSVATITVPKLSIPVLAIEDDLAIRRLMVAAMSDSEFELVEAANGAEGLQKVAQEKPEIILLDMGLPDMDGIDLIRDLRTWSSVPVIFVSAQGDEQLKIAALEAGADDYVTKPFSVNELLARMRVAWRRVQALHARSQEGAIIRFGDVVIDQIARVVTRNGKSIHCSPIEYKLLAFLAQHAGRVVTQSQILTAVWGGEFEEEAQYLRVYIGYLRKKLEDNPKRPTIIVTEPRIGYRLIG